MVAARRAFRRSYSSGLRFRQSWLARLLCLLSCLAPASYSDADDRPAPPNVVLIISDDQAWTDYGFMGHPTVQTPRLDRLARESRVFTRGYVPSSLCRPSLASLITGLYPRSHGIVGNDPAAPEQAAPDANAQYAARRERLIARIDACDTLPKRLATAGYLSLQTGKWWEGGFERGGFSHGMTRGFPHRQGRHGDQGLALGRPGLDPIADFLAACREARRPFFLWFAPMLPHTPHDPPAELLAKYAPLTEHEPVARYWAMCERFDQCCGQLLDLLDAHALRNDTLVVYVTDNGWINRTDASAYAPRSKRSPYEGGIRTPIMLRWPGRIEPGMDRQSLVSSVDLAPTIYAAANVVPKTGLPGLNLLDAQALTQRRCVRGEIYAHDVADVERPAASLLSEWIICGHEKLIVSRAAEAPAELFDLAADPHETVNLAAERPARVAVLASELARWPTHAPAQ